MLFSLVYWEVVHFSTLGTPHSCHEPTERVGLGGDGLAESISYFFGAKWTKW